MKLKNNNDFTLSRALKLVEKYQTTETFLNLKLKLKKKLLHRENWLIYFWTKYYKLLRLPIFLMS